MIIFVPPLVCLYACQLEVIVSTVNKVMEHALTVGLFIVQVIEKVPFAVHLIGHGVYNQSTIMIL